MANLIGISLEKLKKKKTKKILHLTPDLKLKLSFQIYLGIKKFILGLGLWLSDSTPA
jgi:hypothetical protein